MSDHDHTKMESCQKIGRKDNESVQGKHEAGELIDPRICTGIMAGALLPRDVAEDKSSFRDDIFLSRELKSIIKGGYKTSRNCLYQVRLRCSGVCMS